MKGVCAMCDVCCVELEREHEMKVKESQELRDQLAECKINVL